MISNRQAYDYMRHVATTSAVDRHEGTLSNVCFWRLDSIVSSTSRLKS